MPSTVHRQLQLSEQVLLPAQRVVYRKVLEDDGNRQKVEVEQLARWKILMFSGSFSTRLFVYQDKRLGTVSALTASDITRGQACHACMSHCHHAK